MAYRGKIACHFPEHNPSNYNVDDIAFLPAGGGANDLLYIDKVYALPVGTSVSSVSDLEQYLVWEKILKVLIAGNQNVAIQYIPAQDISVTDIGIFTNENSTGRQPRIKIFHDSGLCVAFTNGDVQTTNQVVYELNGSNHDASIQATTLKAGQKYYIVYSPGYGCGNAFYPAYFQNTNGNYKVYENENESVQVFDISENAQYLKPSKYKGIMTNSMGIFAFSTDDWFVWMGSTQTGMSQGQVYRRTNVGEKWTFTGIIGDPDNVHTITAEDLRAIISKPPNADFIWYVDQVPNMNRGEIWGKPSTWITPTLVDISTYGEQQQQLKLAFILKALNTNSEAMLIGSLFWNNKTGQTYELKTGYISDVTSTTPLTAYPANPQDKHIYFLSSNATSHWEDAVWVYENSTYTKIGRDEMNTYFQYEELSTKLEKIGTKQDLLEALYNADYTFLNATVNTDKKFYLKLNGNEV